MGANDMSFRGSLHNRFDIEIIDKASGNVREKAVAYNIVTEQLWARLFSKSSALTAYANYIHYGTGTGVPSVNDTSLFGFTRAIACSSAEYEYDSTNRTISARRRIQISETMDVGVTITEMGIAYATGQDSLCTHAMILDVDGNPYGILKTDKDVINIYSTIYLDLSPKSESGDGIYFGPHKNSRGGITHNHVINFLGSEVSAYTFAYAVEYIHQRVSSGSNSKTNIVVSNEYRNIGNEFGNKIIRKHTITVPRYTIEEGNCYGGIGAIRMGWGSDIVGYFPTTLAVAGKGWYPGTRIVNESVATGDGSTKDYPLKFRYVTSADVFVNGIKEENVDISYVPYTTRLGLMAEFYSHESTIDNLVPIPSVQYSSYQPYIYYKDIPGNYFYMKIPFNEIGIDRIEFTDRWKLSHSNDFINWTEIGFNDSSNFKTFNLDESGKHAKFFRFDRNVTTSGIHIQITSSGDLINAIHFRVPPEDGAVITANYYTQTIAKDSNHVLDFSMVFDFSDPGVE